MPAPSSYNNRKLTDFFKPFTIPKKRIPQNAVIEDEIIVASPKLSSSSGKSRSRQATASPAKSNSSSKLSSLSSNASTPTKPSHTRSPKKRTANAQSDGAADVADPLVHVSSPSSQQRVMTAVDIPSPKLPPPPPPRIGREAPTRDATTSFSSVSSLSSVPMSTQSSSRRIVKNGVQAVTNSDSGSADSDSDQLADPSTFIVRKRRKLTSPGEDKDHAIEIPSTVKPARQSARLSDRSSKQSSRVNTPRLPPSPPRTVYKHSILSMAKQAEKQGKTEARIREAETKFEELQRRREEELEREKDINGGLKAAVADDSDEGERMMLAMQRTEALQEEEKFYYFRKVTERATTSVSPQLGKSESIAWKVMLSQQSRTQAYLSGFVAEVASRRPLPQGLCGWLAGQLTRETREDLCESYVEVLRAAAAYVAQSSGSAEWLDDLCTLRWFYNLTNFNPSKGENEGGTARGLGGVSEFKGPPVGLRHVLSVMQYCCAARSKGDSLQASCLVALALASLDDRVQQVTALQLAVQEAMEYVLDAIPHEDQFDKTCEHVHAEFSERTELSTELRCRVIACLPATTERCHILKRRLALHLVTQKMTEHACIGDIRSLDWAASTLSRLKRGREFVISDSTNYTELNSLITVLDIAVDAGFGDLSFRAHLQALEKPDVMLLKPSAPSPAVSTFNAQIDAITAQLRLMSGRIRDTGTSHLRRTETKSAIERLIVRLDHSVRTRPKPKQGVFGGLGEQTTFLSGFLKKLDPMTTQEPEDAVSVVPLDMLSDRDVSDASAVSGAEDE